MRNNAYIRQLVQELMKWLKCSLGHGEQRTLNRGVVSIFKLQLELLNVYYLWTRASKIVCTVYCKYTNLLLCTPKNSVHLMNLCTPFSPLHIAVCQLNVLGFPFFLQQTTIIVLFCGMVSTLETEKYLTLTCIRLCVTGISLRDGCNTLRTFKM